MKASLRAEAWIRRRDEGAHACLVNMSGQCFGEEIGSVLRACLPLDGEMTLTDAITDPMKAHVDAFGPLYLQRVVGEPNSAFVIAYDQCGGLLVTEGSEDSPSPFGVLRVDE